MGFAKSDRLIQLPPYLFMEIDRMKAEIQARGVDIIDLGVGDPDLPTPPHIIKRLTEAASDPSNHRYPSYSGMQDFKTAAAEWYNKRFNVDLDPSREVLTLIGSKEGIAHFPLAFLNPGDVALVPSPAYPVYHIGTLFAGGTSYFMPLVKGNQFLPDLDGIPKSVLDKSKILFLNYPNNPTGATASLEFFEKALAVARANNLIICHDAAYSEMSYDGYRPPSFLEIPGARETAIEFHSLSKTYNMTGWRIGFAVGDAALIEGLGQIKSNIDSGAFQAVQWAGIEALRGNQACVQEMQEIYTRRRNILVEGLNQAGWKVDPPKATFYLWVTVPKGYTSAQATAHLLKEAGIVTTPGNGFGRPGEGYIRMTLTVSEKRMAEAVERIKKAGY